MLDFRIRPATAYDYEAINAVFVDELAHHVGLLPHRFQMADPVMPRSWFQEVLTNPDKELIVAELDGLIVGQILIVDSVSLDDLIYRPRRYLYVDELAILAGFRGRGIGQRLMAAAENWASERGITTVELDVWQANKQAIAFYERLGYQTIRRKLSRDLR